jgi:LytR cell envelope-related transcriptional attenuator
MEPARLLQAVPAHSPLTSVRLRRQLPIDLAAKRAGISEDEAQWLEEGRVYRFRSQDEALLACVLYAAGLEIHGHEARELAGLPAPPSRLGVNRHARLAALVAVTALISALAAAVAFTHFHLGSAGAKPAPAKATPALPQPWQIQVDVLNGSGDINFTRRLASRVGALGYRIGRVAKATRFDYPRTTVYFEPGGSGIAVRLARRLGVTTSPLPAGSNPRRLVVIAGPHRGPG